MWREGRPILVWEGYILGKIRIYLCNVVIREPKIPTDDQMVLGELIGEWSGGIAGIAMIGPPGPLRKRKGVGAGGILELQLPEEDSQ